MTLPNQLCPVTLAGLVGSRNFSLRIGPEPRPTLPVQELGGNMNVPMIAIHMFMLKNLVDK